MIKQENLNHQFKDTFEQIARKKALTSYEDYEQEKEFLKYMQINKAKIETDTNHLFRFFNEEIIDKFFKRDDYKEKLIEFAKCLEADDIIAYYEKGTEIDPRFFNEKAFVVSYFIDTLHESNKENNFVEEIVEDELNNMNVKFEKNTSHSLKDKWILQF